MIVHHNNTIIHIVDGPKPTLRYKEIHKAIQPGDTFMMKCELFTKENAVPTIGQILMDSTLGVILCSPSLSKVLEKKTLKELLEDKELGRKLLSKGGFKCLI